MDVKNNTTVNFCGNSEILYNLGKALNKAQYMANAELYPQTPLARSLVSDELASVLAYLDSATHDRSFIRFIDSFKTHLKKPTNSRPGGISGKVTLPEISNRTSYFGNDENLKVRARGFKIFEKEFLHEVKDKLSYDGDTSMQKFHAFLDAIKPSIKPEDMAQSEQVKAFNDILTTKIDYLS